MGLKSNFTPQDVDAFLKSRLKLIDQAIIRRLQVLGEKIVIHARTHGSYTDQTGNLRNSIGYVILKDGRVLDRNFERTSKRSGKEGPATGQRLAEKMAKNFPTGYVLIAVAGMNYAASVESKGKDVLSSAEIMAKTEFPRMIRELKLNIKNAA